MPRDVHLVGSVPGESAAEVFEKVSAALGPHLKRIPDGATGERADWIVLLDPVCNEALKREIDKIASRLPHDQIAIQFDVASAVFARLERNDRSSYGRSKDETRQTFARILIDLASHVPGDIELLFHFCYGD